jgi:transcriptional regulator with XRE-family HTH domain
MVSHKEPGCLTDGKFYQDARVKLGWTQATLAARTGLCYKTIARIENGRPAKSESLLRLNAVLLDAGVQLPSHFATQPIEALGPIAEMSTTAEIRQAIDARIEKLEEQVKVLTLELNALRESRGILGACLGVDANAPPTLAPAAPVQFQRRPSLAEVIPLALQAGPRTYKGLHRTLKRKGYSFGVNAVSAKLSGLKAQGIVCNDSSGLWRLVNLPKTKV